MYIAITSIDNGYMVEFTKYKKTPDIIDWRGIKVQRYFPTPESIQIELTKIIKEAS